MSSDKFKQNAHLYLGISRSEFARRTASGQIDLEIFRLQVEQNSLEIQRDSESESVLRNQSAEQVDKFRDLDDPPVS